MKTNGDNPIGTIKAIIIIALLLVLLVSLMVTIVILIKMMLYAYANPELTRTQLFIYWMSDRWGWPVVVFVSYIGLFIVDKF